MTAQPATTSTTGSDAALVSGAEMELAVPAKRAKTVPTEATSDLKFRVCFEQLGSLKQLVDVVGSILGRVYFQLEKHPSAASGESKMVLSIDTIDPQRVCLVQSRLICNGSMNVDEVSFCICTQTLTKCLRNLPNHHSVSLSCKMSSATITLQSFDVMSSGEEIVCDLPTYDDDCENMPLDDLDYEYETDIELPELKRMIKFGDALKCEVLKMSLHSYTASDGSIVSMTQFSGSGDADFKRSFPSIVCKEKDKSSKSNGDVSCIDYNKMKLQFEASFTLDYFNKFVKAMEHQQVNLKFGKDSEGSDLPLTIKYPLGVPDSYVRFVLAPKIEG